MVLRRRNCYITPYYIECIMYYIIPQIVNWKTRCNLKFDSIKKKKIHSKKGKVLRSPYYLMVNVCKQFDVLVTDNREYCRFQERDKAVYSEESYNRKRCLYYVAFHIIYIIGKWWIFMADG